MLERRAVGQQVEVTFRIPFESGAARAVVTGEFNGWSHDELLMDRDADSFVARVLLAPGRAYRFRYLLDGDRWENDWQADDYVDNEHGGHDSLLDLRRFVLPAPEPLPEVVDGSLDERVAPVVRLVASSLPSIAAVAEIASVAVAAG